MSIETTKTKTKMKSGTIAIIALSIVLVLSLVTTITLAYFTATRNVVTTINFANGVRIQLAGAYETEGTGTDIDSPADTGPKTLYWKATYKSKGATGEGSSINSTTVGTYDDVDAQIFFEDLKVKVIDMPAAVAVRIAVKATKANGATIVDLTGTGTGAQGIASYTQPTMTSDWVVFSELATTDTNKLGWFRYNAGSTQGHPELLADTVEDAMNTATSIVNDWTIANTVNDFAGVTLVCTVTVFASNTLAGLTETVDNWNAADIDTSTEGTQTISASDTTNKVGYAKLAA